MKERFKQQLTHARQMSERMLGDFKTPQQWTHQVQPGVNHALWFAGHMANSDNFFISVLAPEKVKDLGEHKRLFGVGSQPVDDPSVYPAPEEVLAAMRERREVLMQILDSLSEADLARKTPAGTPDFLGDVAAVFETAVWHEGMHTGQLSIARRAIGGEPLMG
jgi:predicted neuraminidase